MATKKTTTKAKTKTTKAAKSTSSRAATKKAKASSAAPAVSAATAAVVTGRNPKSLTVNRLSELQRLSAGLFVLLAIAAGYLIKTTTINLTFGYLTNDDLASKTQTIFTPAIHSIYDVNIRWVVVAIMALSAVLPLLWTFSWKRQYQVNVDAETMPQRWLDNALTLALIVETIAALSGIHDLGALKMTAGLVAVSAVFGWLADHQNRGANKPKWSAYFLGIAAAGLAWLYIGLTAVATWFYGIVRYPWYVYALYGTTFIGFWLIWYLQRQQYRTGNKWKFAVLEQDHILTNIFIKASFALVLIIGLHR